MTSGAELLTYIPLSEAAERYRLSVGALNRAVERGTIKAVKVNGDIAVAEEDVDILAIDLGEGLRGKPIRATEAAEKYGVSIANLSRWADAGYIHVIEHQYGYLVLDEAEVKRAAKIFKKAREETGSSISAGWALKRTITRFKKQ